METEPINQYCKNLKVESSVLKIWYNFRPFPFNFKENNGISWNKHWYKCLQFAYLSGICKSDVKY